MHLGIKTGLLVTGLVVAWACGDPIAEPGEQSGKPTVSSNQNPEERVVDPKKGRRAYIVAYVEPQFSPYQVEVVVRDVSTGKVAVTGPVPVAGGMYTQTLDYTSGERLLVRVEVKPSRNGSTDGYCTITDGKKEARHDVNGGWRALCELTTIQ